MEIETKINYGYKITWKNKGINLDLVKINWIERNWIERNSDILIKICLALMVMTLLFGSF